MELQADAIISTAESNSTNSKPRNHQCLPCCLKIYWFKLSVTLITQWRFQYRVGSWTSFLPWHTSASSIKSFELITTASWRETSAVSQSWLKCLGIAISKWKLIWFRRIWVGPQQARISCCFLMPRFGVIWGKRRNSRKWMNWFWWNLKTGLSFTDHSFTSSRCLIVVLFLRFGVPPAHPGIIENFFFFYPIEFVNERTKVVFQKVVFSISERLILLEIVLMAEFLNCSLLIKD